MTDDKKKPVKKIKKQAEAEKPTQQVTWVSGKASREEMVNTVMQFIEQAKKNKTQGKP